MESDPRAIAQLGAKGASLVLMRQLGLRVPAWSTIDMATVAAAVRGGWSASARTVVDHAVAAIEEETGSTLGGTDTPLLLSVRSGAARSMPGMMETALDVGVTPAVVDALRSSSGRRHAGSVARRSLRHHLRVVHGRALNDLLPPTVTPSDGAAFAEAAGRLARAHCEVPLEAREQLMRVVAGVARSAGGDRAMRYRERAGLTEDQPSTAVTIQRMVFGDADARSGTGVVLSDLPVARPGQLRGDVAMLAQGDEVVGGRAIVEPVSTLARTMPEVWEELRDAVDRLRDAHGGAVEVEFTIERGRLFLLQCRRSSGPERATSTPDPSPDGRAVARGFPGSGGSARGVLVTDHESAHEWLARGHAVVLARPATSPEDVDLMALCAGVITFRGGVASHAAIVAREWGIPAVVGVRDGEWSPGGVRLGGIEVPVGTVVEINGGAGTIRLDGDAASAPVAATAARPAVQDVAVLEGERSEAGDGDLLALLEIRGPATVTHLGEMIVPVLVTPVVVEDLLASGWLRLGADDRLRLTDLGFDELARRRTVERARARVLLDEFAGLDDALKTTISAWQLHDGDVARPNQHHDEAYDAQVLDSLGRDVHHPADLWLAAASTDLPRLDTYRLRLSHAYRLARAGRTELVADPRCASFHTIWFELHRDLILSAHV